MIEISLQTALFRCAVILATGLVVYRLLRHGIGILHRRGYLSTNADFLFASLVRWSLVIVVVIMLLQAIGLSVHTLWAALSTLVVMVAIGFVAMWSVLSNLLCAILLVVFAPFRIGDEIELVEVVMSDPEKRGIHGRVIAINMLYTIVEDLSTDGVGILRIPNNLLFQRAIRTIEGDKTKSLGKALFKNTEDD